MSEPFARPLSVVMDYRGDEPQIVIDGTNYARNILGGSVIAEPIAPVRAGDAPRAKVTVTFMVDDLRVMTPGGVL